jgi:endoglucanase
MKWKLITMVLFAALTFAAPAQPVKKYGQLKVEGSRMTDAAGNTVVLRGMSFGWHNLWPRFYNSGTVHELVTNWNCSVIRASMGIELNDSGYLKDPSGSVKLMKRVIDACIKEGVYVIIDWHDHNIHTEAASTFFRQMAKKYCNYQNIIYEVYNEPDYETWTEVKIYSASIIKVIREYDKNNIILVGCPRWDQDIHLPATDPLSGFDNLMYTVHFYAATHKQWLRDRADSAIARGLPIFISESAGMEATGDGPLDEAEWQRWIAWMDDRKLSWISWSVSDKDETCSVLKKTAGSKGKWKDSDLKEYGLKIRAILRGYAKE